MHHVIRNFSVRILLLAVLPLSGMPESKIPSDVQYYGGLFLAEDESSAYAKLEKWVFDPDSTDQETARRIAVASNVITNGEDVSDHYVEPLIAKINAEESENWLALRQAAQILGFAYMDKSGVLSEGKFLRGYKTGGPIRYSHERDKFHAIDHFLKAIAVCKQAIDKGEAKPDDLADLYLELADCLQEDDFSALDFLTDLNKEPALAKSDRGNQSNDLLEEGRSPALDANGNIQLPAISASFEAAPSNLARQRWLIEEAEKIAPAYRHRSQLKLAELWRAWLDVDQLMQAGYFYIEGTESESDPDAPGEVELHTLESDQTILIAPTGLKRVTLPPEFRFIEILKNLISDPKTPSEERFSAYESLFEIYGNRRQFDRGEQLALELKKRPKENEYTHSMADSWLEQIQPDGRFIDTDPFIAGAEIEVEFLSRNMDQLNLELWRLDVEKTVHHGFPIHPFRATGTLERDDQDQLLPYYKRVRQWTSLLKKRPRHLQSHARIPIQPLEAGCYYLVARGYGKTLGLPIQVEETMLVGTKIDSQMGNYLLLDSKTGKPITDAEIILIPDDSEGSYFTDLLGTFSTAESHEYMLIRRPGHPPEIKESVEAYESDGDPTARSTIETFFIANQPLYRPGQTVNFSCWLRQPGNRWFDATRVYRDTKIRLKVADPTGSIIYTEKYVLDDFGSFSGSFKLDPDIALGSCKIALESMGSLSKPEADILNPFAGESSTPHESWAPLSTWLIEVGEFRKPDFRVDLEAGKKLAGGLIEVIVSAKYNSGEPMMGSEVSADLIAIPTHETPFPKSEFEQEYDSGYDWPLPESRWMPDWQTWGIRHSLLEEDEDSSHAFSSSPIRRQITGITGEDGKARLVFPGKLPRIGELSFQCEIRAEVKESSGRTMQGELIFTESGLTKSLFILPGKGFYKFGEEITMTLNAMDSEREPLSATGSLRVDRLSYDNEDRSPAYEKILERSVSFGDEGQTIVTFSPPAPGQYLCMFTSENARRGIVLNVLADGNEARELRFNSIQLTPRKSVCALGEKVEIAIHCDKPDALVWLFQLMPDGRRQTPRLIQMRGKVATVEIVVPMNGTPNFQLLAMTASNGRVDHGRCQITVPARESMLAVALHSAPEKPKPGDPVQLSLSVRDHLGLPTRASFAITAYDRSLEDLSEPLPKTRRLLPYIFKPFHGEKPLPVANRVEYRAREAFQQLWEPGCFSDKSDLVGEIVRKKESRFANIDDELILAYEPPGISGGGGFGCNFPITPASPASFSNLRPLANRIDLDKDSAKLLKNTATRSNFADYAHWGAAVTTDAQGHAKITFPLPDNLTAWKAQAWAFGQSNRFGDAEIEIAASKPLQVRPIIPRSAVHGDKLEIAATIQNLSDRAAEFHVLLEVHDLKTNLPNGKGDTKAVTIPAGGEGVATWPVELLSAGTAKFCFVARSTDGSLSDGTELPLIIAPRTTPYVAAASEIMASQEIVQNMNFDLSSMPAEASLRLRVSSHSATDAFGAVPVLAAYPFGCVEQTLNRFFPLLIASKKFTSVGGDWDALIRDGAKPDNTRGWIRGRPLLHIEKYNDPLTLEKSKTLVSAGLKRLLDMANKDSDDAWGWFEGGEPSPYLTALVIRAFEVARRMGVEFEEDGKPVELISTRWLELHARKRAVALQVAKPVFEPEDAFIVHVLSLTVTKEHLPLQEMLLKHTDKLALSARIFLALSLDPKEQADALAKLLPPIHKEMQVPDDMSTDYRHWWEDSTETRAWYLMLLTDLDPGDGRIPEQVERLLAMRTDGLLWKSTRDTALCVEAIAGTLDVFEYGSQGTQSVPLTIEIAGKPRQASLNLANCWTQEISVPITPDQLVNGQLHCVIRRQGASKAIVRASASVRYDSDAAKHHTTSSNGLQIHRTYYLIRKGEDPLPLEDGAEITAGDHIEVEIKVRAPLPRDFVHISDPIPAGLEPLHQLSGYDGGGGAYREARLGESHLFIQHLVRWNDTFRYQCQVVTPGTCLAMPTRAECMYAPAIFGSTPASTLRIRPRLAR